MREFPQRTRARTPKTNFFNFASSAPVNRVGLWLVGIPMMSISHSDLMPIRSERSDAGLSQCETVTGIRQEFW
jgi:hypothetical protein